MKFFLKTFLCLCLFCLCLTCGIDEIPVLSKPQKGNTSDTFNTFEFRITENNGCVEGCYKTEPDFLGFEIYYKFFSSDLDGQNAANSQSNKLTVNELESNSFRRISFYINDNNCDKPTRIQKPLIPVPKDNRGKQSLITISFNAMESTGNIYIKAVAEETDGLSEIRGVDELEIRRNIEDPEKLEFFKSFEDFTTSDADVNGVGSLELEESLIILVYVLSYGKYNLSETIYSEALCLSWINVSNLTLLK
ncbi:MAG: hypothetical protein JXJ04_18775 [Spirochaetales bacterium]|nr:hypothetical protein [Spirochaetales bacterium]